MTNDLHAVASQYCECRVLADDYESNLLRVAKNCQRPDCINTYLKSRLTQVSARTVRNERDMLLILLRWGRQHNLIDSLPPEIVKIRVQKEPTKAWTLGQACTVVKRTSVHVGKKMKSGADRGEFLRCWTLLAWETGARWGDLWKLRDKHFDGPLLRYSQNKTCNPINTVLTPTCTAAVNAMLAKSPDGTVLRWACGKRWAMRLMKQLVGDCGVDGTSKWFRRSAATQIEIERPGQARLFLGHKSVGMCEKHYLDWSQIRKDIPRPPPLLE